MKILPFFLVAFSSLVVFGQESLTAEFKIVSIHEMPEFDFAIKISQRPGQLAATLRHEDMIEYLVVDNGPKKMLQVNQVGEGTAIYRQCSGHSWETSFSPDKAANITQVFDYLNSTRADKGYYRLLPEKKMLFGKECQKIELLDNESVFGTGWIMLGIHIEFMGNFGWDRTSEGTIVETAIPYGDDVEIMTLTKLDFSASPNDFSFDIPADCTMMVEGDDSELYNGPVPGDEDSAPEGSEDE